MLLLAMLQGLVLGLLIISQNLLERCFLALVVVILNQAQLLKFMYDYDRWFHARAGEGP